MNIEDTGFLTVLCIIQYYNKTVVFGHIEPRKLIGYNLEGMYLC